MADRVYPSAKPAANGGAGAPTNPPFPATKAQLYGASRPAYRPQPPRRHRRSCCCSLCIWLTLAVILLLLIAATAAAIFYVLYRPHRPTFTVDSVKVSYLNVTASNKLTSKLNFTVTARNPNKKLVYLYDPITVAIAAGDAAVGDGAFPAFVHGTKNTTTLRTTVSGAGAAVDDGAASKLRSDLKSKSGAALEIKLETKVRVKVGGIKSPKVGIRVSCDGIRVTSPAGKTPATATTKNAKCEVDLRIKIWKWTF